MRQAFVATLATLAALFGVVALLATLAGCTSGTNPAREKPQEGRQSHEKSTQSAASEAPVQQAVRAEMGEPVDVGPSTIEVVAAHKTQPNPAKGYEGKHFEGTFVAVQVDVTNDRKKPFEIPMDLPWYLYDPQGRQYAPDELGYTATYTFAREKLMYAEEQPLVNTAATVHLAQAYPVVPEPARHYILQGSDPACPQCAKMFKIRIPGDLMPPEAPSSAPATAVPSASASASGY
jgi:hypothetical protein